MVLVGGEPGSGKSRPRPRAGLAAQPRAARAWSRAAATRPIRTRTSLHRALARCSGPRPTTSSRRSSPRARRARADPPGARPAGRSRRRSRAIPTPRATAPTSPSATCCTSPPRRARSCWSSRISTGRMSRPCTCSATSRGPATRACSSSPRSATRRPTFRELADTLADLRRSEAVVRLRLDGFTAPEIDELVCRVAAPRGRRSPTSSARSRG